MKKITPISTIIQNLCTKVEHSKFTIFWIVLLAFLLRLPLLNNSFWLDEAAQALESYRPLNQQLQIAYDFQPPLFHLIVFFLSRFSSTEGWLRLSSLIAGLVMIWATFQIGEKIWNRRVGLIASFLLSISSFHIFYSQELRPYALAGMWACISWLILVKYFPIPANSNKLKSYTTPFLFFIFVNIAGVYTTYLFPFCFAAQLFYLMSFRSKKNVIFAFLTGLIVSMAFVPWLPFLKQQLTVSQELRLRTPTWEHVVSTPQLKALPLVYGKFLYGVLNLELNWVYLVPLLLLTVLAGIIIFQNLNELKNQKVFLLICWIFVPILAAWFFSFFIPVLQAKRVLFSLPALMICVAIIIDLGVKKLTPKLAIIFVIIFVLIQAVSTGFYYADPVYQRENWRSAITQIDTSFSPARTVIIFRFDHPFSPWDWYTHKPFRTISTGTNTKTNIHQIDSAMEAALDYDQVIVFDYLRDLTDPQHFVEQWLESYNYKQTQVLDYKVLGFVRIYTKGGVFADTTIYHD